MTQPTQPLASQASNWPTVEKALFWKQDSTVMKIVTFITGVIIVPLAFLMDIISKAKNYVFPKTQIQEPEPKPLTWKDWAKNSVQSGLHKCSSIWTNHKKAIIGTTIGAITVAGMYHFGAFTAMKEAICCRAPGWCGDPTPPVAPTKS